jgi:deferrochelatase/peroxidase EfeB
LTGETGDNTTRPAWAKDGSFLVFRQLKQYVPEFNKFTVDNPIEGSSELTGARLIGRWKSVSALIRWRRRAQLMQTSIRGRPWISRRSTMISLLRWT